MQGLNVNVLLHQGGLRDQRHHKHRGDGLEHHRQHQLAAHVDRSQTECDEQ